MTDLTQLFAAGLGVGTGDFNVFNLIGLASLGMTLLAASIVVVNRSRDAHENDGESTP